MVTEPVILCFMESWTVSVPAGILVQDKLRTFCSSQSVVATLLSHGIETLLRFRDCKLELASSRHRETDLEHDEKMMKHPRTNIALCTDEISFGETVFFVKTFGLGKRVSRAVRQPPEFLRKKIQT